MKFDDCKIDELPVEAVFIPGSVNHYATPDGQIYRLSGLSNTYVKVPQWLDRDGFSRVHIRTYSKYNPTTFHYGSESEPMTYKKFYVSRLIAELFVPNSDHHAYVIHKNGDKTDNRAENLKWGTHKDMGESVRKIKHFQRVTNPSPYQKVVMRSSFTDEIIGLYNGLRDAERHTGECKSTIKRHCRDHATTNKGYYFRYVDDDTPLTGASFIVRCDWRTDKIKDVYANVTEAAKYFDMTPSAMERRLYKPKPTFRKSYFRKIKLDELRAIPYKYHVRKPPMFRNGNVTHYESTEDIETHYYPSLRVSGIEGE